MKLIAILVALALTGCAATPEQHAYYGAKCEALGHAPSDACKAMMWEQERANRMSGYSAWRWLQVPAGQR